MNHNNINELSSVILDENEIHETKCLSEKFWLKRFNEAEFFNFPYLPKINYNYTEIGEEIASDKLTIFNLNKIPELDNKIYEYEAILTLLVIYFSKINNYKEFYIGYNYEELLDNKQSRFDCGKKNLILKIHLNSKLNFKESYQYVKNELENVNLHKYTLREMFQNSSLLAENNDCNRLIPLAIHIVKNVDSYSIPKENYLTILLSEQGGGFRIVLNSKFLPNIEENELRSKLLKILNVIPLHLNILILDILKNQNCCIQELEILTDNEKEDLLIKNNKTLYDDININKTIHQIFEEQVECGPKNQAVIFNNESITYEILNKKSNYLAHNIRMIFQNIKKDELIIVFMEKNIDVYISFLAILKAGGAFVPIDPEDPLERIKYIIDDTKASIIITQKKLLIKHSYLQNNNKIILIEDLHTQNLHVDKNQNLSNINCPQDLAYVMYTSGTTGQPKGVKIEHKGVTRLVKNTNYVSITPDDRIMQASKIFFDASTFEIWGALLNGAVSCIVDKNVLLQPHSLANYISHNHISISFLTTGLFNEIASQDISVFYKLKKLYIGGEAARPDLVKILIDSPQAKHLTVHNIYGPTECTTFSTYFVVRSLFDNASSIPIGKPISGAKCYILNDYLELLPAGVTGELCISGPGLSRGYLNNEELSHTKFILNPYTENKNYDTFLYRTGDLARYLDNGNIELVGRIDQQVKLRGYRIELKEIEICLSAHPGIQRCAVKLKENSEKRKIIIAYFIQNKDAFVDQEEIINYLKQKLPQYMIPALFMKLDLIPLTKSGKIDYNALPDPIQYKVELSENNISLETDKNFDIEKEVFKIWQETLELGNIDFNDNFFDIGGDSLLLMGLHSKLEVLLKKEIPLSILFEYTTISTLSSYLGSILSENDNLIGIILNSWKSTLEINNVDIHDNFFDIGGDSLLLMRLHNTLETSLKKSIPLNALFTYTTISEQEKYFSDQKTEISSQLSMGQNRAMKRLSAQNVNFGKIVRTNIKNQL